jgi:hypothetical protein
MKDMKRTKADRKSDKEAMKPTLGEGSDYHHGLSVHLDHESLKKLGMHTLPKVGDKLHLHAHAHVTEVREEHRDGGKPNSSVHLQLRKMDVQGMQKDDSESRAEAKAEMDKALSKHKGGKAGFDAAEATEGGVERSMR